MTRLKLSAAPLLALILAFSMLSLPARAGSLTDIGYANGITLSGTQASQTVYFPLPAAVTGAVLHVHFAASGAVGPHSSVTVLVNHIPLATMLDSSAATITTINIPVSMTTGQFLQVTFTGDETIDDDVRCFDNNVVSNWAEILPDTNLTTTSSPAQGVGALWRNLGTPLTIALPAAASRSDIQSALILSTALVQRGIAPYFNPGTSPANIVIDPTAGALKIVALPSGASQLVVPSPAAARALVAADQLVRNASTSRVTGKFIPVVDPLEPVLTLGALGEASVTVDVGRDAKLDLAIPASHLPTGKHARAVILYGQGSALPAGDTEVLALEVGGNVVWSQAFSGAPSLQGVRVNLPDRLVEAGAPVVLHFTRLNQEACKSVVPLPFTLQDDTSVVLSDGNPSPERFAAFNVSADAPVAVMTDLPAASLAPSLPLLSELLGAAGANPSAIEVTDTAQVPTAPFILVSHKAGGVVSVAPVPDPATAVELPLPNQAVQVSLPTIGDVSLLQLVSSGADTNAIPGLWLSPGPAASLAQAALPGDGNVAVYDGSASPATFLTLLHSAQFAPVSTSIVNQIINNWNNELFGLFWIAVTILTVIIFVRRRRAKK